MSNFKKGTLFAVAVILGISLFLLIFLGIWIWNIDRTWSPLIEPRIRERQEIGSVRVLARDSTGKEKWIGSISSGRLEERQPLKLSEVPPQLIQAIVVLEDPRFLQHGGFDVWGILRAAIVNVAKLRFSQGGSTLTQQLVKNVFLSNEKTLSRKFTELVLSTMLENRFSKEEILEAYINEVYLGQLGSIQIHGVGRATEYYFNKKVDDLEVQEMALLAAMIAGPGTYSPWKAPEKTKLRRDRVLKALADKNLILPEELEVLTKKPLPGRTDFAAPTRAAYLMDAIRENLLREHGEMEMIRGGFDVHLALDLDLQSAAERAMTEVLPQVDPLAQGLAFVVDPKSCHIKAYVGGSNYRVTQLDRIRQSKRAIGSLMKPLELSRLLDDDPSLNLATSLNDSPFEWSFDKGRSKWKPVNYDGKFRGPVSVRKSLEESLNVPIAKIFYERFPSGLLSDAFDGVRGLGLEIPPDRALPSAILGAIDQSPWNVMKAYVKLVRQALGLAQDPGDFECQLGFEENPGAESPSENTTPTTSPATDPATPPPAPLPTLPAEAIVADLGFHYGQFGSRLAIAALEGAIRRGTSKGLGAKLPSNQAWAAKTGTSSDGRDAWYAALSPDLVVITWIGRDDNAQTKLTGASGAVPIAARIIEAASKKIDKEKGFTWPSVAHLNWWAVRRSDYCMPPLLQQTLIKSANPEPATSTPPPEDFTYENQVYYYELFRDEAVPPECSVNLDPAKK